MLVNGLDSEILKDESRVNFIQAGQRSLARCDIKIIDGRPAIKSKDAV